MKRFGFSALFVCSLLLVLLPKGALTQIYGTLRAQSFRALFSNAVTRDAHGKAADIVSLTDFGARAVPAFDNLAAFNKAILNSSLAQCIFIPDGVYEVSNTVIADHAICLTGSQWRIKYTGGTTIYGVLQILGQAVVYAPNQTCGAHGGSCYGDHTSFFEGTFIQGAILDGQGNATNGLVLQGVVSGHMNYVKATNVTDAGFMCNWCQQITFEHPMVSSNFEAFTTTPARCLVIDNISSANTVDDINCEHVTGTGIDLIYALNTVFKGGTSEGIATSGTGHYGVKIAGNNPSPNPNDDGTDFHYNVNNDFTMMDLEENRHGGDIYCGENCYFNTFKALSSFSNPGFTLDKSAHNNTVLGGTIGTGSSAGPITTGNRIIGVSAIDITGSTIWIDNGFNHVDPIYNQFNNVVINPINGWNQNTTWRWGTTNQAIPTDPARPVQIYNNSIGTIADIVVGLDSPHSWIGLFSQAGATTSPDQTPFMHYTDQGMCFLGEPTLRSTASPGNMPPDPPPYSQIDGCIIGHQWGIGTAFSAGYLPITSLHIQDQANTIVTVQDGASQVGSMTPQMVFRSNSGLDYSTIRLGVFRGATHAGTTGSTFTVSVASGGCTISSLLGGATAGQFHTTGGSSCSFLITMGMDGTGTIVAADHDWSCSPHTASTGNLMTSIPSGQTQVTFSGNQNSSGDTISFGCIGY